MDMRPPPGVSGAELRGPGDPSAAAVADPAWPPYSYAFQPIVDAVARRVVSYEALVRGARAEPAGLVLRSVAAQWRFAFDQASRETALALSAQLGYGGRLNLNFLPQAPDDAARALARTADQAARHGIALDRLVIEVTEEEAIEDPAGLAGRLNEYRGRGMAVAIDDFGAGYSGLNLLAEFQPDAIKVDMKLVRGIEGHGPRQAIVRAIAQACTDLGIDVIAEGVESQAEFEWFAELGVRFFQDYLFARPAFEQFAPVQFPPR